MTYDVSLTVAVCTHNPERQLLQRVISAIAGQLAEVNAELIIVDNNSAPALSEQDLGEMPAAAMRQCRIVSEPTPGLTAARARAIKTAVGEVLLFVDDDNILTDGYLAQTILAFESDPRLGLLGGSIVGEYLAIPPTWLHEFERRLAIRPHPPELYVETSGLPHTPYWPIGAGFAVRHSIAKAYQDDSDATTRIEGRLGKELLAGEDVDLALFVLSREYKLLLDGSLRLVHVIPQSRTTPAYVARCYAGGLKSTLALERKWAPRFGNRIFADAYFPLRRSIPRLAATALLRPLSPRYMVRHAIWRQLVMLRLRTLTRDPLRRKPSS